jgi:hypothetical protein
MREHIIVFVLYPHCKRDGKDPVKVDTIAETENNMCMAMGE